jgi:hypothetical protein
MQTWLSVAKASAWTILTVAGVLACLLLFQASNFVYYSSKDSHAIAIRVEDTFDTLNADCGKPGDLHPCGTLADIAKTMNTIRGTFGQIELAANHENKNLSTLDAQEAQLFADTRVTMAAGRTAVASVSGTAEAATTTLQTLNTTVQDFQPLVGHFGDVAVSLNDLTLSATGTVTRVNEGLDSPATHAMTQHFLNTLTSVDTMAAITAQVETKATHDYLHPSTNPGVRMWQGLKPFIVPTIQIGGAVAAASIH